MKINRAMHLWGEETEISTLLLQGRSVLDNGRSSVSTPLQAPEDSSLRAARSASYGAWLGQGMTRPEAA